jgi:hypothetical protein
MKTEIRNDPLPESIDILCVFIDETWNIIINKYKRI